MNTSQQCPVARLAEPQVRAARTAAAAAPSPPGHAPWLFRCTDVAIEMCENEDVTHISHTDRVLACGGAPLNLRLAVQTMGIYADVRLAPGSGSAVAAGPRPADERAAGHHAWSLGWPG